LSLNCTQLKDLIERTLTEFDSELITKVSVRLLLATAAQESQFGTYLVQTGRGPARGIFQMEPGTHDWLREYYVKKYPQIADWKAEEMEWDLKKAIVMARLRYRVSPEPLPEGETAEALWPIYKKVYNTNLGKATQYDFINRVHQYVRC